MMKPTSLNVSRETSEKLTAFAALVQKWTKKINLISRGDADEIWQRHIWDSAQLFDLAPKSGKWVDLGSGGGFPAIVISILSQDHGADHQMVMVESDQRKAVFLRTAIRELELPGEVISKRIDEIPPLNGNILSARALAELTVLLGYANRHLADDGIAILPKGENWKKEYQSSRKLWSYKCDSTKSKSNPDAVVLKIKDIARV